MHCWHYCVSFVDHYCDVHCAGGDQIVTRTVLGYVFMKGHGFDL